MVDQTFLYTLLMKIAVTGGAGYCGVPLSKTLLERGHTVRIVDNFAQGVSAVLPLIAHSGCEVVRRDIQDDDLSYMDDVDGVLHLAGLSGFPACDALRHAARAVNVEATRRITRRLSPSQFIVFPSSTSFYGSSGAQVAETTTPMPISLYGQTKWEAEQAVMEHRQAISLRWATVFGLSPCMRWDLMVNDFTRRAATERAIVLYDADSLRSFIHIDDVVRGYLFALDHLAELAGGIYNMGSDRLNFSKRDIAQKVQAACPCDIFDASAGATDARSFIVSYARIAALGFECMHSVDTGIAQLLKYCRLADPLSPRTAF